eukprot:TRINITY_DN23400_c0_g1_i1.p1 TRINITY_DN23400_c0_g1~~TRINITY_DN23400_c0_g1_i1.p1  ORF type:complete len:257 (-),score=70.05 TRINITY_DN23400_c0_g1_i1:39-728(-)
MLEAQLIPVADGPDKEKQCVKVLTPPCADKHTQEKEAYIQLREEFKVLLLQLTQAVSEITRLEKEIGKSTESLEKFEADRERLVAGVHEQLRAEYKQTVTVLQDQLHDLEKKWQIEQKKLSEEKQSLYTRASSLESAGPDTASRVGAICSLLKAENDALRKKIAIQSGVSEVIEEDKGKVIKREGSRAGKLSVQPPAVRASKLIQSQQKNPATQQQSLQTSAKMAKTIK